MTSQPFSRINTLVRVLTALLQGGLKYNEAFVQSGLAGYRSRGHGKQKPFTRSHFSNKSRQGSRGKYMPHQGKQEIARRTRQAYRDYGNGLSLAWDNPKLVANFPQQTSIGVAKHG